MVACGGSGSGPFRPFQHVLCSQESPVRLESNFRADQLLSDGTEAPWVRKFFWEEVFILGHHIGERLVCGSLCPEGRGC